jgi:hypothetical protein
VGPGGGKGGSKAANAFSFLGKLAVTLPIVGFLLGEASRINKETSDTLKAQADQAPKTFEEVKKIWAGQVPTFQESVKNGVTDGFRVAPPLQPLNVNTSTTLKLDGKVIAQSVDKYLGMSYSYGGSRVLGR